MRHKPYDNKISTGAEFPLFYILGLAVIGICTLAYLIHRYLKKRKESKTQYDDHITVTF